MNPAAAAVALAAVAATLAGPGCTRDKRGAGPGVLTVSVEQQAAWVRNFNPLLAAGGARWPTHGGVYEPLLIFNAMQAEWVPWLATGHTWSDGGRTLTFPLREGVLWSDGAPFTAADVAFTFALMRQHKALDANSVWGFLESVQARGTHEVVLRFKRVYIPGLELVAHQPIVPKHVWEAVDDPVTFSNPSPVATGPFTEVRAFGNQVYELGRNPRYWQPGKPALDGLRFPAFPSNDAANLGLVTGEVDWAGNFVPAIDRVYVARDPAHHHYWFPLVGTTVFLYANTARAPFDDVRARKALSMGIDRARVVAVAMYDYTRPSDVTGLSDAYASWRSEAAASGDDWTRHDLAAADRLLDAAGHRRDADGMRRGPDGAPLTFDLLVVNGWTDWVRAAQVIARDVRELGLEVSVRTYDFSAWFERVQRGDFDLAIGWSVEGPTPFGFYRWLMSGQTRKPLGEASAGNWHRFAAPAVDALLTRFERTTDPAEQRALVDQLQAAFVAHAPAIPLFPNPAWGAYNSSRFEGFPTAADPYAKLSPNALPEALLVLTRLRPAAPGAAP